MRASLAESSSRMDGIAPPGPRKVRGRKVPMYGAPLLAVLLLPYVCLLGIGFLIPLGHTLYTSIYGISAVTGEVHSGQGYEYVVQDPVFFKVLLSTIEVSGIVAGVCLLIAYPTAEFILRARPRMRPLLVALVIIPLWSSTIARTYSWVGVLMNNGLLDRVTGAVGLGRPQLLYTQTAVILGMVHVLLPVLLLPVYAAVRNYDERLTLASLSLGAGRVRTLFSVKLPTLLPPILAGTVAIFVVALGFYVTPALLGGASSQMVSNLISQQVLQRFDLVEADAMSMILVATVLVALVVFGSSILLLRRRLR